MNRKLTVSVVIPTYNRVEYLKKALKSLLNQSYMPNEIIVIDDGSTDGTKEFLMSISKKNKLIKYYFQKNGGPSKARNLGIKNAKGDIICFFDDDEIANKDWIKEIVQSFESEDIGGVGGPCIELEGENIYEKYLKSIFVGSYSKKLPYLGGNLAFYKKILQKVGGFDEHLKTGEDVDLSFRIYLKNYKIRFNEKMIVYHFNPCKNFVNFIRKGYYRGFYYSYLNKKYPIYFNPAFRIFINTLNIITGFIKIPVNIKRFFDYSEKYYLLESFLNCIYRLSVISGILSGFISSNKSNIKLVYNKRITPIKEEVFLTRLIQKIKNKK